MGPRASMIAVVAVPVIGVALVADVLDARPRRRATQAVASLDRAVRTAVTHAAVRKAVERATELRPHIEAARKAGCTTLRQLAHALNESGITTARGGKWDASAVWWALRRMG